MSVAERDALRAQVYWVPGPWPGRLGIVPRPRGGDWLSDEVRSWRASGLEVVSSLLTPDEEAEFELQEEEARAHQEGCADDPCRKLPNNGSGCLRWLPKHPLPGFVRSGNERLLKANLKVIDQEDGRQNGNR